MKKWEQDMGAGYFSLRIVSASASTKDRGLLFRGLSLIALRLSLSRESPDCPSLRASGEHSFTVRVLRARRAPGRPLPTVPSSLVLSQGWGLIDLPLRASMTKIEAGVTVEGARKEPLRTEGSAQALNPMRRDFGVGGSMS